MSHKIFGNKLVAIRKSCIKAKQTRIPQNVYFGTEYNINV